MAFHWFQFREKDNPEMVKPFLDHLEDLRWTLIKMLVTLSVTMAAGFLFRVPLMQFVQRPLREVNGGEKLVQIIGTGVADSMTVSFTLAFYGGVILAFPLLLYFLADFVLPALTRQERRYVLPALGVCFGLFLTGVGFSYFGVLPLTLKLLAVDQLRLGIAPSWTISQYLSFVTNFTLAFGLSFELPVGVLAATRIGLVNHSFLARTRRYAVVVILLVAMFIAPPDLLTMLVLATPMMLLYEGSIWVAWWIERVERRRAAKLEKENQLLEARREEERRARQKEESPR